MIRITKQSDYGIVLMTRFAADRARGIHTARDLASETYLPLPTVSKILKALARGGILQSHRGVKGGYSFARSLNMIAPRPSCRFCGAELRHTFVDLGMSPLCESYVSDGQLNCMEPFYPLHVYVCHQCFLVQLLEYVSPAHISSEYAYFSSYSASWTQHAKEYVTMAIKRFNLDANSQVVEIASNDGYLLQYFVERQIPVLGIEPAANM